MAHSNRENRKAARLAAKRARKAAWASKIGTSRNKKIAKQGVTKNKAPIAKVKTAVAGFVKGKKTTVFRTMHAGPACGNVGCKRCFDN